jgi:hypothetical protein
MLVEMCATKILKGDLEDYYEKAKDRLTGEH